MGFAPNTRSSSFWSWPRRAAVFLLSLAATAGARPVMAIEKASEQVSAFYGSFSHSIPIEVPGFRGLEPQMALGYSCAAPH